MSEGRDYAILISLSMREEAEVLASALRADGIDAFVGNAHHANIDWGQTIALGGLQVLVPRQKLVEAKEAIRARLRDAAAENEGEPVRRRDHYKLWLLIAGSLMLGLFGIGGVAAHQFDAQRIRMKEGRDMAEAFANMIRAECQRDPSGAIQVMDSTGIHAVPCSKAYRPD